MATAACPLANLLRRRAVALAAGAAAVAGLVLAVWLLPRVHVSVVPAAARGSWEVTVALQPTCSGSALAALLRRAL